jgi:hypothetical protein
MTVGAHLEIYRSTMNFGTQKLSLAEQGMEELSQSVDHQQTRKLDLMRRVRELEAQRVEVEQRHQRVAVETQRGYTKVSAELQAQATTLQRFVKSLEATARKNREAQALLDKGKGKGKDDDSRDEDDDDEYDDDDDEYDDDDSIGGGQREDSKLDAIAQASAGFASGGVDEQEGEENNGEEDDSVNEFGGGREEINKEEKLGIAVAVEGNEEKDDKEQLAVAVEGNEEKDDKEQLAEAR